MDVIKPARSANPDAAGGPEETSATSSMPSLIRDLCAALEAQEVIYCHWKSNFALDRALRGDTDLDLLVSRADRGRFTQILAELGFKQGKAPPSKQMHGVSDYFGYDPETGKLIHVHAHYQMILGHDLSKNFRLSIERAYLATAMQQGFMPTPALEFEFIVFVIRMALKHLAWDVLISGDGRLKAAERRELNSLTAKVNQDHVLKLLRTHLPALEPELFDRCVMALHADCPAWIRWSVAPRLLGSIGVDARHPALADAVLRLSRRVSLAFRRRVLKSTPRHILDSGGAIIAVVGADGAGKTTAIDGLRGWLSEYFEISLLHMGKPRWSTLTICVRTLLKVGQLLGLYPLESSFRETLEQRSVLSPGFPWLIREVCLARDRYLVYARARRHAARGGLAILDRCPLPEVKLMDGPQTAEFVGRLAGKPAASGLLCPHPNGRLVRWLVRLEQSYYKHIARPDVLVVLRVDPQTALRRKRDDDPVSVQERSVEIWGINWERTAAHVIDAGKPQAEVQAQLRSIVWSEI